VGFQPTGRARGPSGSELLAHVQGEILPIEKNAFRDQRGMNRSLAALDSAWVDAAAGSCVSDPLEALKLRESISMLAMARWAYASALARTESRAMHTRVDYPAVDPTQCQRILSGGLDRVWTERDPQLPSSYEEPVTS
jgi:succinate dehydrogenase/fumarate reductase flavoprotein subunit